MELLTGPTTDAWSGRQLAIHTRSAPLLLLQIGGALRVQPLASAPPIPPTLAPPCPPSRYYSPSPTPSLLLLPPVSPAPPAQPGPPAHPRCMRPSGPPPAPRPPPRSPVPNYPLGLSFSPSVSPLPPPFVVESRGPCPHPGIYQQGEVSLLARSDGCVVILTRAARQHNFQMRLAMPRGRLVPPMLGS